MPPILNLALAAFLIITFLMPDPEGWFGRNLFGVDLVPWPIMNGLFLVVALLNICTAYANWSSQ